MKNLQDNNNSIFMFVDNKSRGLSFQTRALATL